MNVLLSNKKANQWHAHGTQIGSTSFFLRLETPLVRRSKAAYSDGVYGPSGGNRPNPLEISLAAHHGPAGTASYAGRTAMLVFFGTMYIYIYIYKLVWSDLHNI